MSGSDRELVRALVRPHGSEAELAGAQARSTAAPSTVPRRRKLERLLATAPAAASESWTAEVDAVLAALSGRASTWLHETAPDPGIRWQLLCSFEIVKFDKGAVIVHEGALSNDGAYVLLAGAAEVFKQMPRDEPSDAASGGAQQPDASDAPARPRRRTLRPLVEDGPDESEDDAPDEATDEVPADEATVKPAAASASLGTTVAMLEPGAIFGEVALSMGWQQARTASVVAAGETNLNAVFEDTLHENRDSAAEGVVPGLAEPGAVGGGSGGGGLDALAQQLAAAASFAARDGSRTWTICLRIPPASAVDCLTSEALTRRLALVAACPLFAPLTLDAQHRLASSLRRVSAAQVAAHAAALAKQDDGSQSKPLPSRCDPSPFDAMILSDVVGLVGTGAVRLSTRAPCGEMVELGLMTAGDIIGLWHLLGDDETGPNGDNSGVTRSTAGEVRAGGTPDAPRRLAEAWMPLQRAPARARFSVLLPKLSHQPLRPSDDDSSPPASERFEGASPREELELYVIDAAAVRAELRDATNGASGRLAACDLARRLACRQLAFERARLASALVHAPPPLIEIERDAARAGFGSRTSRSSAQAALLGSRRSRMTRRPPMMRASHRLAALRSAAPACAQAHRLRSAVAHRSTASSSRACARAPSASSSGSSRARSHSARTRAVARHPSRWGHAWPRSRRTRGARARRATAANRSEVAAWNVERSVDRGVTPRAQQSESERAAWERAEATSRAACASIERLGGHRSIHMRQAEGYFATAEKVLVGMRLRGYLAHLRKGLPNATPRRASRRALLPITT